MYVAEIHYTVPTAAYTLLNWRSQGKVRTKRSFKVLLSLLLEGESSTVVWKMETDHDDTFRAVRQSQIC